MMRNFKGLTVCSCLAFALFYGDCWGMEGRTESLVGTSPTLISQTKMQEAINKWSHLVPKGEVKSEIDNLVPQVLESREKMEELVTLICKPENSDKYAYYAHIVFKSIFTDCANVGRNKLERMLDTIADHRNSGGGTQAGLYWVWYEDGYFDSLAPEDDGTEWELKK